MTVDPRSLTAQAREALPDALTVAQAFHAFYEAFAPQHGYATREESARPWAEVPVKNRALMVEVAAAVLDRTIGPRVERALDAAVSRAENAEARADRYEAALREIVAFQGVGPGRVAKEIARAALDAATGGETT